jgi:hypothetical protein
MRVLILAISALLIVTGCTTALTKHQASEISDKDAMADFLIGWYDTARNPAGLSEYAGLGMNASVPYTSSATEEQVAQFLETAASASIRAFLQIPSRLLKMDTTAELDSYIDAFIGSDFWGWYLADEPELNRDVKKENIRHAIDRIRLSDSRPLFIMHYTPEAISEFSEFADVTGVNYYPAFKWTLPFLYVGEPFIARLRRAALSAHKEGKRFLPALQAYGRAVDGSDQFLRRLPSAQESIYMFWAAISVRPDGILYWAKYRSDPAWISQVLGPLLSSFRSVFPGKLGYWPVSALSENGGVSATGLVGEDGSRYVLFVNHGFFPRTINLSTLPVMRQVPLFGMPRLAETASGRRRIAGHSVALLALPPKDH